MFNLKTHIKNTSVKTSKFWFLLFWVILNIFFITETESAAGQTYSIALPQKVTGVEKLEYIVNGTAQGNTGGKASVDLSVGTNLYFLLKMESTGYSQLLAKNVKIVSDKGTSLSLKVFEYDENHNITERDVSNDELIDPNQTYVSSICTVNRNEIFNVEGVELDKFSTDIKLESTEIPINEALDVTYQDSNGHTISAAFDNTTNSYSIKNILSNTALKIWISKKYAYSQSEINFSSSGSDMIQNETDKSIVIPEINSNVNITVQNIAKNKYSLSFTGYSNVSFKYKKDGSVNDFELAPTGNITVTHGENYYFTCEASAENALSGKEITANGVTVRAVNGVYLLSEISENIIVAITGENNSLYKINLPSSEKGVYVTNVSGNTLQNSNIKYGESLEFKISPTPAYTQNIDAALIYAVPTSKLSNNDYDTHSNPSEAGNYLLTPSASGVFTVSSVKEPMAIIVKNLDINTYKVTLPQTVTEASYTVTPSDYIKQLSENRYSVIYGKSMEITLSPIVGKSVSNAILTSDNNPTVQISKNENKYTIQNITNDTDIIISNITAASYDVTFSGTGMLCKNENGDIFENNKTSVIHETGAVKFKIEPAEGYEVGAGGINVRLNSGCASLTATPDNSGYYTLSSVSENTAIEITGIISKTVTVSFSSDSDSIKFTSTSGNSNVLSQNNPVNYGSNFEFKVASTTGEDTSGITLGTDNGSELTYLGNNAYFLSNVSEDTNIVALQPMSSQLLQQTSSTTPSKWKIARNIEMASSPIDACSLSYANTPPSPSTYSPLTYSLSDDSTHTFTQICNGSYAPSDFISYRLYYDADHQHEITNSMLSSDQNYRVYIKKDYTYDNYSREVSLSMDFEISKTLQGLLSLRALHTYDYSDFSGGIDNDTLVIFDTIYIVAEFRPINPIQANTNINFSPPPKGARYYSVDTTQFDPLNNTTNVTAGSELDELTYTLENNKEFFFIVRLDEGYEMDEDSVKVRPNTKITFERLENVWPSENRYCYKLSDSHTSDVQVYVDNVRIKTYNVDFLGDGTNFLDANNDQFLSKIFNHGDAFSFTTASKEGYKSDGLVFKLIIASDEFILTLPTETTPETQLSTGSVKITAVYDSGTKKTTYTLSDIKGDFNIEVTRNKKEYTVYFEAAEGIKYFIPSSSGLQTEITPSGNSIIVEYERNLSFVVEVDPGYDIRNIKVTANHETLDFVNGKYTIKSITQNITVRVENISKLSDKITFTQYEGLDFKDANYTLLSEEKQVNYGESFEFRALLSEAYYNSEIKIYAEYSSGAKKEFIKVDQPPSNPDDPYFDLATALYKINIKENVRIYAEGISLNKYNIKLVKAEGISYQNQYGTGELTSPPGSESDDYIIQTVTHGNSFAFKALPDEGYDASNLEVFAKKASVGSARTQMFPSSEVYTLENITEDYTITTENISKVNYQIEFRVVEGGRCIDDYGNEIGNTVSVKHGSDFSFKVSLDGAYNNSSPTVTIKGTNNIISPNADKSYTITNITSNKIIEIINITKNSYKATFRETEGIIYKTAKNKPFTGSLDVEYGSTLYFKISLLDAYDKSYPWVMLNGEKTLIENGGVYSLEDIRDNVEIVVKNVVKNPEEVTMDDVNNVPDDIASSNDVDSVVKATQTYLELSDEEKKEVISTAKLESAQQKAGALNHKSGEITIDGVDWNIKLVATSLNNDESKIKEFSKKVDRRLALSLYEVHLINILTNKDYEVPYGQKVSVLMPVPDLTGYKNIVVVHEKSSGSLEYLDVNITNNMAQFQTSSFSLFGIAAKQIPNFKENPSDIKISVSSLVKDQEELQTLLGEGLVSKLGNLIEQDDKTTTTTKTQTNTSKDTATTNSSPETAGSVSSALSAVSSEVNDIVSKVDLNKAYDWAMNNELISVILIIFVGSILIVIIIIISKKQNKES